MSAFFVDYLHSPLSVRKLTDEGYLSVSARVARTGVQQYVASEIGLTDRNPDDLVNVYRSPDEVFSDASLASYLFKEITDDHPPVMVDANTYKSYSVGQVVSIGTRDGDWVKVDLLIKDKRAIERIEAGKVELSAGYSLDYFPASGTADGQEYEFVQRNIRINHVALVDKARAGNGACLMDSGLAYITRLLAERHPRIDFRGKSEHYIRAFWAVDAEKAEKAKEAEERIVSEAADRARRAAGYADPREILRRRFSDALNKNPIPVTRPTPKPQVITDARAFVNDQLSQAWRNPSTTHQPAPSTNGREFLNQQIANAWRR